MPADFPTGSLRISRNARYLIAGNWPYGDPKFLDAKTGIITAAPVDNRYPMIRQIAADGTTLLLIPAPPGEGASTAPAVLSLWRPDTGPRPLYSERQVTGAVLSDDARLVAFESVRPGNGQPYIDRNLQVLNT